MWIRVAIGAVLVLVGAVWIGQGAGWIHGSFMTGEVLWLVIGIVVAVAGAWLVVSATRARRAP
ncbi:MAG TPA: hypothetical protein VEP49_20710 [Acidimicrobiia bacterium]|nr:hypothetical protein [Acidimicrobiia bacterium]